MTACVQPGCTGSIVDGYCDVCGSPAPSGTAGASAVTSRPAAVAAGPGGRCTQPGCTGSYVDGYCDVCGSPAPAGGAPPAALSMRTQHVPPPSADEEIAGPSAVTRGSSRLSATALGSQRMSQSGSVVTRRVTSGSQRLRSARLGAGLTRVPPAPTTEPLQAIMQDPQVPEDKRVCPNCGAAVGRSRDGKPGRAEGFCPNCRNPFSFTPKLKPGELVASQYEVAGCLAHGGLGWIYLARDKNVSDRWVVLKGLLNSGDPDALEAAIVERQFLAQVEHPLIVEIYNFVTHGEAGYIVMEYVGGQSLKQILKARMRANGGRYDALPVDQALAYILEVLPAFTYLHDLDLVYCDFKPDNLIQVGDDVKLIDLGGVRRIDDQDSAIFGTVGYQAPEVARMGTTVASDIYTIGRTLVVLMMEFRGYQTKYVASLPPVDETSLFAEHDSLYRLLAKACAPDPADRFATVDEFRVQLLGVLREVVAEKATGPAQTSAASVLFESPVVSSETLDWSDLPRLRPDTTDPQYATVQAAPDDDPGTRLSALDVIQPRSAEVQLARIEASMDMGRPHQVEQIVNEVLAADPWEWRAVWMSGLAALARNDIAAAQAAFNAVYGQVPGELAPKLALALACERGGEHELAERLYGACARTDATYVAPAAFGLARIRGDRGDVASAVAALDLVPSTSRGFTEARRLRATRLYESKGGLPALADAMASLNGVRLAPADQAEITVEILRRALDEVTASGKPGKVSIGPYPADANSLRDGLESTYRTLAQLADTEPERHHLVDQANEVRRWTLT